MIIIKRPIKVQNTIIEILDQSIDSNLKRKDFFPVLYSIFFEF